MNHLVQSQAFTKAGAEDILDIGDCTNVDVQGSTMSELIRQQLHSVYYSSTCGKYCVCASKIGGCTLVSPGQGGPASDHQCMEAGGLFEKDKWKVPDGEPWPKLLYDAGVSAKTKTLARSVKCNLVTSGTRIYLCLPMIFFGRHRAQKQGKHTEWNSKGNQFQQQLAENPCRESNWHSEAKVQDSGHGDPAYRHRHAR